MKRLVLAAWMLVATPAFAAPEPVLGIMPPYPGATRPLPHWESHELAIALTKDKAEAVIAYYIDRLERAGWRTPPGTEPEAYAAALAGEPAWLAFEKHGAGRLDIQIAQARHPKTQEKLTFIYYQSRFKP